MKKNQIKPFLIVLSLIAVTCVALGYSASNSHFPVKPHKIAAKNDIISLSAQLVQDKIFIGGDEKASMALTMRAADLPKDQKGKRKNIDMIIVLDRSGSMQGKKILFAKKAIHRLVNLLSDGDRIALVSYSNGVSIDSSLVPVTNEIKNFLYKRVGNIMAGGGTNLGAGLKTGIDILLGAGKRKNPGRIILISDGLANKGITGMNALGNMASVAPENNFAISTVGVGDEFNEVLMTAISDRGAGNYYYMENPVAFAKVFEREFYTGVSAVATSIEIKVPLKDGISLVEASGYPVTFKNGVASFYPGDLRCGQSRKIFLKFKIPPIAGKKFEISGLTLECLSDGEPRKITIEKPFYITCVTNKKEAYSSIKREFWEKKVIQDDFNKLRDKVSKLVKQGKKDDALAEIRKYQSDQKAINQVVCSPKVTKNIEEEVSRLENVVKDTFSGSKDEVYMKQKHNSKSLQFKAYKERRAK